MYNNLGEILEGKCGKIRIVDTKNDFYINYCDLKDKSLQVLYNLNKSNLKEGDKLIIRLEDNRLYEIILLFWACILGGIVPILISDLGLNKKKLINIAEFVETSKVIATNSEALEEIPKDRIILLNDMFELEGKAEVVKTCLEDTAFIQFSSGTTGIPKGSIITHCNILANIEGMKNASQSTNNDTFTSWMPLSHDMGLIGFHILPIYADANQNLIPTSKFIKNPLKFLTVISETNTTIICATNFALKHISNMYKLKKNKPEYNFSKVNKVVIGAEPISVNVIDEFCQLFSKYNLDRENIYPVYGLSEATLAVSFPSNNNKFNYICVDNSKCSVGDVIVEGGNEIKKVVLEGKPIEVCNVKIVDEFGEDLREGTVGYIKIKGKSVIRNYYKGVHNELFDDSGWFNTKDIGFMYNNCLAVLGRENEIIYSNGKKYFCHELEEITDEISSFRAGKVAYVGVYNETKAVEEIICFIANKSNRNIEAEVKNLNKILREEYRIIVNKYVQISDIPKTTSGKIQRFKMKSMYKNGEGFNINI